MSPITSTSASFSRRLCMITTAASTPATTSAMAGSFCNPHTSLTMTAPSSTARAATFAFMVSTESGAASSRARRAKTGSIRASSSAAVTGVAPGRVDSPPTSTIAQPSAASVRACAMAASAPRKRPPSEKESGVTFTMPMTAGRAPSLFRKSSRLARWSARIGLVPRMGHLAVPAHDAPFGVLVDPLGEIGLGIHRALANRALPVVLKMLLLALARLSERADRHNEFDHAHHGTSKKCLAPPVPTQLAIDTYGSASGSNKNLTFPQNCHVTRIPPQRPAEIGAAGAFDHDRAAPHAIAGASAGPAPHHDHATPHPDGFAAERGAEVIAGCAQDLDLSARHRRPGPRSRVAPNGQASAAHQPARLRAGVADNLDLAARQRLADPIETVARTFDADARRLSHAQAKDIADRHRHARGLQLDPLDLGCLLAGEPMRHQRREIKPLIGTLAQGENQRRHGRRSRR